MPPWLIELPVEYKPQDRPFVILKTDNRAQ